MHLLSIIVFYTVVRIFDNSEITRAFSVPTKVVHCDYMIGALQLGVGHSGTGAFQL